MNLYVEIPQGFAETMDGEASNIVADHFAYAVTADGRYVTALLAVVNYPQDFMELKASGWNCVPEALTDADFPVPENEN